MSANCTAYGGLCHLQPTVARAMLGGDISGSGRPLHRARPPPFAQQVVHRGASFCGFASSASTSTTLTPSNARRPHGLEDGRSAAAPSRPTRVPLGRKRAKQKSATPAAHTRVVRWAVGVARMRTRARRKLLARDCRRREADGREPRSRRRSSRRLCETNGGVCSSPDARAPPPPVAARRAVRGATARRTAAPPLARPRAAARHDPALSGASAAARCRRTIAALFAPARGAADRALEIALFAGANRRRRRRRRRISYASDDPRARLLFESETGRRRSLAARRRRRRPRRPPRRLREAWSYGERRRGIKAAPERAAAPRRSTATRQVMCSAGAPAGSSRHGASRNTGGRVPSDAARRPAVRAGKIAFERTPRSAAQRLQPRERARRRRARAATGHHPRCSRGRRDASTHASPSPPSDGR